MKAKVLIIIMFCIISIFTPVVDASSTAAIAATSIAISSSNAANNARIERLKDENCITNNLPEEMSCNELKLRSKCIYDCYHDNGVSIYNIDYNTGHVTTKFMTYEEIERQNEMNKNILLILIIIFLIIFISIFFYNYFVNKNYF